MVLSTTHLELRMATKKKDVECIYFYFKEMNELRMFHRRLNNASNFFRNEGNKERLNGNREYAQNLYILSDASMFLKEEISTKGLTQQLRKAIVSYFKEVERSYGLRF